MLTVKEKRLLIIVGVVILVIGGMVVYNQGDKTGIKIKNNASPASTSDSTKSKETKPSEETILVHLGGAVTEPGVYECQADSRLYKVLKKADGPTSQADLNAVNLAKSVQDGEKIIIPTAKDVKSTEVQASSSPSTGEQVNINTANQKQLQQLTGIGPTLAGRIMKYRQQHNSFQSKQELTKISGIGNKTLAKLKEQITY